MKIVINGKLYNTATMTILCSINDYNNGNYTGDRSIRVTRNGNFAFVVTANGQDIYRQSRIEAIRKEEIPNVIDGWKLDDDEVEALAEHDILVEA